MKFAMFYEIPVARPWTERVRARGVQERDRAGRVRRARWASTPSGPSSTTSSRSTRTAPTPRCSTARSPRRPRRLRIGYGVRLLPKPYNHPVRSAESAAVLDLISDGRVEFGTGRSSTRAELEGFGIHPHRDARDVAGGARAHRRLLDQRRVRVQRQALVDAASAGCCRSRCRSRTRRCGARPAAWTAHRLMGQLGLGLLSFSVGTPPEELKDGSTSTGRASPSARSRWARS